MKVSELQGALLDYYVARAEGVPAEQLEIREVPRTTDTICVKIATAEDWCKGPPITRYDPSTNWALSGPLLEKHRFSLTMFKVSDGCVIETDCDNFGDTPLIAICRAVVRAAFGDEVEDQPQPVREKTLEELGFKVGAVVEHDWGLLAGKERAVITCVHPNGGLDVTTGGKTYGWSASRCKVVG